MIKTQTNTCQHCGAGYWVKPYRRDRSKYCCASCKSAAIAGEHLNKGPKPWAAKNLDGHRHKSTSRFACGHTPWNKGATGIHLSPETEFKAGRESEKRLPVWSVTQRTDKSGNPRAWVKTPDGWRPRAQVAFTNAFGEIPDGHVVHHKDGDTLNDDPANLEALTPAQHAEAHRSQLNEARNAD